MSNKIALITGASSGIGRATAILLSKNGYDIVATGRRKERLEELRSEIITNYSYLVFDVRDKENVQKELKKINSLDLLVNNAGNAHGRASIQDGSLDDWDAMIDINVKGLLYVTNALLPKMKSGSHIVNIGSVAGREVYPNGNVYCASKHAVHAISEAMRMDLLERGIKVTNIAPGLVETEFSLVRFKGDEEQAKATYEGFDALQPQDIAETIVFAVTRPAHVSIADVLIFPTAQASSTMVKKS